MNKVKQNTVLCLFGHYFNWDNITAIDTRKNRVYFNCCGQYAGLSHMEFDTVPNEEFIAEVNNAIKNL